MAIEKLGAPEPKRTRASMKPIAAIQTADWILRAGSSILQLGGAVAAATSQEGVSDDRIGFEPSRTCYQ